MTLPTTLDPTLPSTSTGLISDGALEIRTVRRLIADVLKLRTSNGGVTAPVVPWVDVKAHKGAVGDGAANDTQAFIDAASELRGLGGGVLYVPPGTYMVGLSAHPNFASYFAAFTLSSNVVLQGCGRAASKIKLIASQTQGWDTSQFPAIIIPWDNGQDDIEIRDITIDGNGANQTHTHYGILLIRTQRAKHYNVLVKNCRGTASSGVNETFHFETQNGLDTLYVGCEALGDAGSTASGFSADKQTLVEYVGCSGHSMSVGHGFTHNDCKHISYTNCHAYFNTLYGFNCEESRDVAYVNCTAGGKTSNGITPYPLTSNNTLGNTSRGFVVLGTNNCRLVNCVSTNNGSDGIIIQAGSATYGTCSGEIVGGDWDNNGGYGINYGNGAYQNNWRTFLGRTPSGNSTAALGVIVGNEALPGRVAAKPAVPASTVAQANTLPFDVDIYVYGGTGTVGAVDGTQVYASGAVAFNFRVRLRPAQTITLTYTVAPVWEWYAI
jgi:Pectate lyase superfamily protein